MKVKFFHGSKAFAGEFNSRRVAEGHIGNHLVYVYPNPWIHGYLHIGIPLTQAILFHQPCHQDKNRLGHGMLEGPGIVKGNQAVTRIAPRRLKAAQAPFVDRLEEFLREPGA